MKKILDKSFFKIVKLHFNTVRFTCIYYTVFCNRVKLSVSAVES